MTLAGAPTMLLRRVAIARWQLTCLRDPATRDEALRDLGDGLNGSKPWNGDVTPDWTAHWSAAERSVLVDIFLAERLTTWDDLRLITIMAALEIRDDRLPQALFDKVVAHHSSHHNYWTGDYLLELARQLDDPGLDAAVRAYQTHRDRHESVEAWEARRAPWLSVALERAAILIDAH